jgi:hypothetical protein
MPWDMLAKKDGRRPRKSTVSCQTSVDPCVSEWENPRGVKSSDPRVSEVALGSYTKGIETSQYLLEKKSSTRSPE